jgi:hypothetical protein
LGGKYVSIYDIPPCKPIGVTRTTSPHTAKAPDACGAVACFGSLPYADAHSALPTLTPALLRHLVISLLHLDLFTPARAQVVK